MGTRRVRVIKDCLFSSMSHILFSFDNRSPRRSNACSIDSTHIKHADDARSFSLLDSSDRSMAYHYLPKLEISKRQRLRHPLS